MIFAAYGVVKSESDIATCCHTDIDGTLPTLAANCARSLGFEASSLRLNSIDSLRQQLEDAAFLPITYVHLGPILGVNTIHAVVIEAIDVQAKIIRVIDPANAPMGFREWALPLFELGWQLARYQVILVKHPA